MPGTKYSFTLEALATTPQDGPIWEQFYNLTKLIIDHPAEADILQFYYLQHDPEYGYAEGISAVQTTVRECYQWRKNPKGVRKFTFHGWFSTEIWIPKKMPKILYCKINTQIF